MKKVRIFCDDDPGAPIKFNHAHAGSTTASVGTDLDANDCVVNENGEVVYCASGPSDA